MALAAIVRFVGFDVHLLYNDHAATDAALYRAQLGAKWDDEQACWVIPGDHAKGVADLLEDLGYTWEIAGSSELNWTDDMFASTPERLHYPLAIVLSLVLYLKPWGDHVVLEQLRRSWLAYYAD